MSARNAPDGAFRIRNFMLNNELFFNVTVWKKIKLKKISYTKNKLRCDFTYESFL